MQPIANLSVSTIPPTKIGLGGFAIRSITIVDIVKYLHNA